MFTSRWVKWLDEVDPYAIQRVVAVKSLCIATVLVWVYWVFRPASYTAYVMPALIAYYYESPLVRTVKEKDTLLLLIFAAFLIGNVSFYLIYPFRVMFFYYTLLFFSVLYYLVSTYFSLLKSMIMLITAYALFTLSDTPPANLQVAYDIFFSGMLSMVTIYLCLKRYPNRAFLIWSRAIQKYLASMEADIDNVLRHQRKSHDADEVRHLGTARAFRLMIPRPAWRHAYRVTLAIRNIQFALNNIQFEAPNERFWRAIEANFRLLRLHMQQQKACPLPSPIAAETELQQYVVRSLNQTMTHWNQLCAMPII